MCESLFKVRNNAENAKLGQTELTSIQLKLINMTGDLPNLTINNQTMEECITLSCCCPFLGGISNGEVNDCTLPNGQQLQKAYRKELRIMSDDERNRLIHKDAFDSGGAHGGPAFCLFHRELTKRYELMIRKCDPDLYLPYWDSTLDGRLPQPKDSCLFTEKFFGGTDPSTDYVINGPFTPWPTTEGKPYISRTVGEMGGCFTDQDIEEVYEQTDIRDVLSYSMPYASCNISVNWEWLEYRHGNVHGFIGGDMGDARISANDICFYFLHCFIFEGWRLRRQNRHQRETDYPPDIAACESSAHFKHATMAEFSPLQNIAGLRNAYTDNMYEYAPRPNCSLENNTSTTEELKETTPEMQTNTNIITTTSEHQTNTKTEQIEETKTTIQTSKTTSSLLNNTETTLDVCQTCQCLCTYKQTLLIPKTRAEEILEIK
uniref:Tyrosinase copper-binding domain-containing protein n=1 Tax=Meloidogyne floridensis TaxID=298350 RepID=A0A915P2M9_9BILA